MTKNSFCCELLPVAKFRNSVLFLFFNCTLTQTHPLFVKNTVIVFFASRINGSIPFFYEGNGQHIHTYTYNGGVKVIIQLFHDYPGYLRLKLSYLSSLCFHS